MSIEEDLRHWLKGLAEEAYPQLATRAALRCAPALVRAAPDQFDGVALSTFRLLLSAQVIACRPDGTRIPIFQLSEPAEFRAVDDAAQAAYNAAESAFRLANSSVSISDEHVTVESQSIRLVDPLGITLSTFLFSIVALVEPQALLSEVREEVRLNRWQIADHPLWLYNPFAAESVSELNRKLTGIGWSFWSRWYERAMAGDPLPWDLQREVALIPDEIWQQGPEAVAERIAEIEARFEVKRAIADLRTKNGRSASPSRYGIGGNSPPEEIETPEELRQPIVKIWTGVEQIEQEVFADEPDLAKLERALAAIKAALASCIAWTGRKLDRAVDKTIDWGIPTGLVYVTTNTAKIESVIAAVEHWFTFLR